MNFVAMINHPALTVVYLSTSPVLSHFSSQASNSCCKAAYGIFIFTPLMVLFPTKTLSASCPKKATAQEEHSILFSLSELSPSTMISYFIERSVLMPFQTAKRQHSTVFQLPCYRSPVIPNRPSHQPQERLFSGLLHKLVQIPE